MAPKIPSVISCSSASLLEYELGEVRAGLELVETEDSWDKIYNALLRLNAIAIGSAADYPSQLITACKGFARPIINSLNSERTRLSGVATDLLTSLAMHLQRPFEALIAHFVPTLLALASRSNKIFIARAKATLMAIVEHCQSPLILPLLRHSVSGKSVTLRLTAIDLLVACLNCFNPPDLETPNRVEDIEAIIRETACDANADVRSSCRKAFEAYKLLFPSRVAVFVAPLTPTAKKYLNIKNATANQNKPQLSSSTSAPSIPLASQPADVLSRSHPVVTRHAKSASTSAAPSAAVTFTRIEKPNRAASKPSSSSSAPSAPVTDSVLMPPPPPPEKKSSSGPVRPPPAMQQAIAAAASSRPKLGRLASRPNLKSSGSMATDFTKTQLASSHSALQRPEKPASTPPAEAAKPLPQPQAAEEPAKQRSATGPRRVPKAEGVPVAVSAHTSAPAPSHRQAERQTEAARDSAIDKGKEKEQSTFVEAHAPSRPPSQLASSTASRTGEDEGLASQQERTRKRALVEKEREARKRTESRPETTFRPRPAPRMEESCKRGAREDPQLRPASQTDERQPPSRAESKPVFTRPPSRMEKEPSARPETRAEPAGPERSRKKKPIEQFPPAQPQAPHQQETELDAEAQARALAKAERRSRREQQAAEAARAAEALTRAPSKRGKERNEEDGERGEGEPRRTKHRELHPSQDVANQRGGVASEPILNQADINPTQRSTLQDSTSSNVAHGMKFSAKAKPMDRSATDNININNESEGRPVGSESGLSIKEEPVAPPENHPTKSRTSAKMVKAKTSTYHESHGTRPLAIQRASTDNPPFDEVQNSMVEEASFAPLPPSPPMVPETPAPIRQAMMSHRNLVPATPISKLMAAIQRGFEADQNAIVEEDGADTHLQRARPPSASISATAAAVLEEVHMVKGEDHRRHRSHEIKVKTEDDETNPFFVDMRPRKHKSESSKVRAHNGRREHNDPRVPFMPKAENH